MPITVYKSTDPSAPILDGTAGSLIALLDACLINGYGAKPAAGWTKEYSDTNKAAYRTPASTNQFYLQVLDNEVTDTRYSTVKGYESMTDVDTGTNAFGAPTMYVHKSFTSDATVRPWSLYTNGTIFHMIIDIGITDRSGFSFGDCTPLIAGDNWNTMISASGNTSATTADSWFINAERFFARNLDGSSFNIQTLYDYYLGSNLSGNVGRPYDGTIIRLFPSIPQGNTLTSAPLSSDLRCITPGIFQIATDLLPPISIDIHGDTFTDNNGVSYDIIVSRDTFNAGICIQTSGEWS